MTGDVVVVVADDGCYDSDCDGNYYCCWFDFLVVVVVGVGVVDVVGVVVDVMAMKMMMINCNAAMFEHQDQCQMSTDSKGTKQPMMTLKRVLLMDSSERLF